ncbi:MAG: ATP synthase F0 subunit A [Chitinophagaceae bacterium]|nr:MAG: ATP synthase F0 subunit A [Chitinophagaceae bacterium]
MVSRRIKSLSVAVFSLLFVFFSNISSAQPHNPDKHMQTEDEAQHTSDEKGGEGHKEQGKFDANEVIFGHVMDAHQFHFFSWEGSDGEQHHATLPLPVLLYEPGRGFSFFSSGNFHHGEEAYNGYRIITAHYKEQLKEQGMQESEIRLLSDEQIVAVDNNGYILPNVKVYDFSLTRNVVQMFIALAILLWLMLSIAKKYRTGQGITSAPKGWQNAVEPVIQFVRDEVAKPNIGHAYKKYMPLLLTIFFFILINNIVGLIPGSANVTGNIAFTAVLGLVSFLVITFSGNKHYWGHIFNPPVPFGIKFIMIPVEILSIFTKPFALIIRLFANMLAGHIIIICLISLIFIFGNMSTGIGIGFSPISIAFAVFIYVIEVLVAFIQAFIFTNLTAVFIGQATEDHHQHEGDAHHGNPPTEPVII